jgi:hypothetical protein
MSPVLFLMPTGLADGLALKEQRYRTTLCGFAPASRVPGSPASDREFGFVGAKLAAGQGTAAMIFSQFAGWT